MWIRSQNGLRLIKVDQVWVEGHFVVGAQSGQDEAYVVTLGKYADQEESAATLDAIQQYINNRIVSNLYDAFTMPQAR